MTQAMGWLGLAAMFAVLSVPAAWAQDGPPLLGLTGEFKPDKEAIFCLFTGQCDPDDWPGETHKRREAFIDGSQMIGPDCEVGAEKRGNQYIVWVKQPDWKGRFGIDSRFGIDIGKSATVTRKFRWAATRDELPFPAHEVGGRTPIGILTLTSMEESGLIWRETAPKTIKAYVYIGWGRAQKPEEYLPFWGRDRAVFADPSYVFMVETSYKGQTHRCSVPPVRPDRLHGTSNFTGG